MAITRCICKHPKNDHGIESGTDTKPCAIAGCQCKDFIFSEAETFGTKKETPMKKQSFTTFFYGLCSEDKLIQMIKDAEEENCEFVQIMAGMLPPPPNSLALPGARQSGIPVLRLLVRTTDENYAELLKKKGQPEKSLLH